MNITHDGCIGEDSRGAYLLVMVRTGVFDLIGRVRGNRGRLTLLSDTLNGIQSGIIHDNLKLWTTEITIPLICRKSAKHMERALAAISEIDAEVEWRNAGPIEAVETADESV